jgi:hypothetical protein
MEVEKTDYFHIHKENSYSNDWRVGNVISTPKTSYNNFYEGLNKEYICGLRCSFKEYGMMEYFNSQEYSKLEEFNNTIHNLELTPYNIEEIKSFNSHLLNLLDKSFLALGQSRKMLREVIFEKIRKENYPYLPSRLNCFWLTDEKNLQKWNQEPSFSNKQKTIFKVKATGKLFEANASLIQMDVTRFSEFHEHASIYWQGLKETDDIESHSELLFEGHLEIVSECIIE